MLTLEVGQHEVVHFNVYINTYVKIQKIDQQIGGRSTLKFGGLTEANFGGAVQAKEKHQSQIFGGL